jgi:hypothetical protein
MEFLWNLFYTQIVEELDLEESRYISLELLKLPFYKMSE